MSWTDLESLRTLWQLAEEFNIKTLIETGTWKGVNMSAHKDKFDILLTCELNKEVFEETKKKLNEYKNVVIVNETSPKFLKDIRGILDNEPTIIYLDAHFYDPALPKDKRFVVLDELKALEGCTNCIIVIHDFDCEGLGHITYDGISLDWNLVGDLIKKVNPNFRFYTNKKEYCDIMTEETMDIIPEKFKDDVLDTLGYVWSKPEKTYRGFLYAIPHDLDLTKHKLVKQEWK